MLRARTATITSLLAVLIGTAGWYSFLSNSLSAPSRGTDLYEDALFIGAVFEALPAILISSTLVAIAARSLRAAYVGGAFLTGCAAAFVQLTALAIAWSALVATA